MMARQIKKMLFNNNQSPSSKVLRRALFAVFGCFWMFWAAHCCSLLLIAAFCCCFFAAFCCFLLLLAAFWLLLAAFGCFYLIKLRRNQVNKLFCLSTGLVCNAFKNNKIVFKWGDPTNWHHFSGIFNVGQSWFWSFQPTIYELESYRVIFHRQLILAWF